MALTQHPQDARLLTFSLEAELLVEDAETGTITLFGEVWPADSIPPPLHMEAGFMTDIGLSEWYYSEEQQDRIVAAEPRDSEQEIGYLLDVLGRRGSSSPVLTQHSDRMRIDGEQPLALPTTPMELEQTITHGITAPASPSCSAEPDRSVTTLPSHSPPQMQTSPRGSNACADSITALAAADLNGDGVSTTTLSLTDPPKIQATTTAPLRRQPDDSPIPGQMRESDLGTIATSALVESMDEAKACSDLLTPSHCPSPASPPRSAFCKPPPSVATPRLLTAAHLVTTPATSVASPHRGSSTATTPVMSRPSSPLMPPPSNLGSSPFAPRPSRTRTASGRRRPKETPQQITTIPCSDTGSAYNPDQPRRNCALSDSPRPRGWVEVRVYTTLMFYKVGKDVLDQVSRSMCLVNSSGVELIGAFTTASITSQLQHGDVLRLLDAHNPAALDGVQRDRIFLHLPGSSSHLKTSQAGDDTFHTLSCEAIGHVQHAVSAARLVGPPILRFFFLCQ